MKYKTEFRIDGCVRFGASALILGLCSYVFYNSNPSEYNSANSGVIMGLGTAILFSTGVAINGLTDIVKGTHNYLQSNILKNLTKDEDKKKEIESELEEMLAQREQEF